MLWRNPSIALSALELRGPYHNHSIVGPLLKYLYFSYVFLLQRDNGVRTRVLLAQFFDICLDVEKVYGKPEIKDSSIFIFLSFNRLALHFHFFSWSWRMNLGKFSFFTLILFIFVVLHSMSLPNEPESSLCILLFVYGIICCILLFCMFNIKFIEQMNRITEARKKKPESRNNLFSVAHDNQLEQWACH